jgi:hypothetical protein
MRSRSMMQQTKCASPLSPMPASPPDPLSLTGEGEKTR